MHLFSKAVRFAFMVAAVTAQPSHATEGYFLEGYGTREKGVAGGGAADSRDPLALSINPAGLVDLGRQYTLGLTAFSPDRGYTTTGPGLVAQGPVQSDRGLFPAPNGGYSQPLDETSAWGVAFYGNGGMNTTYNTRDVTLNILAPAVVKHHIAGFSYFVIPNSSIDVAAVVSPKNSVSGVERTPLGANPRSTIDIYLSEFEMITAGWTHRFDSAPAPAVAAGF